MEGVGRGWKERMSRGLEEIVGYQEVPKGFKGWMTAWLVTTLTDQLVSVLPAWPRLASPGLAWPCLAGLALLVSPGALKSPWECHHAPQHQEQSAPACVAACYLIASRVRSASQAACRLVQPAQSSQSSPASPTSQPASQPASPPAQPVQPVQPAQPAQQVR